MKEVFGYQKIFSFTPQNLINIEEKINLTEGKEGILKTNIDTNLSTVKYEWYKNGQLISTLTIDNFKLKVHSLDSGTYHCKLKHPAFPGFFLQTDTFNLTVNPCLSLTDFTVNTSEINCFQTGAITVKTSLNNEYSYHLFTKKSGKELLSESGNFEGLTETIYMLSIKNRNGCNKQWPREIELPTKACKEFLVTPDNDGNMDTFYFSEKGVAKIFDKRGVKVAELVIPGDWDCTFSQGKVPVGYYIVYINDGESQIGLSILY